MKRKIAFLFALVVYGLFSFSYADEIYLDQLGYLPDHPKIAIVEGAPSQFKIADLKGRTVLIKEKGPTLDDRDTSKKTSKIDFSEVATPGNYYIYFGSVRRNLIIRENPYNELLSSSWRSFYLQRCGIQIEDGKTGFKHRECHAQDAFFLPSTGKSGRKNVCGGWHDAGDYGKYVPPANYTVSTLLLCCTLNNPAETVLLKELKHEIDWLLTMQDAKSGGVYHKATGKEFEPFILPDKDKAPRYISRISSAATAGFAGTMAQAYPVFKKHDPQYANNLLAAALGAWQYLEKNQELVPPSGFNNDPEIKTGIYGDNDDGDERLFAAVQLLGATGKQKYDEYFINNYRKHNPNDTSRLGWQDFRHHAYVSYLLLPEKLTSAEVSAKVKQSFIAFAAKLAPRAEKNGFGVVLTGGDYRWGSNGLLMDYAKALIFAYLFTGEIKYKELALEQLHYILGRNAHDLCFITGFGENTVTQLHHRPSIASGLELPGFMAGGPNKYLQDERTRAVFNYDTPPALVYLDDKESYSTNENSIYWNANLVFVLGCLKL